MTYFGRYIGWYSFCKKKERKRVTAKGKIDRTWTLTMDGRLFPLGLKRAVLLMNVFLIRSRPWIHSSLYYSTGTWKVTSRVCPIVTYTQDELYSSEMPFGFTRESDGRPSKKKLASRACSMTIDIRFLCFVFVRSFERKKTLWIYRTIHLDGKTSTI